MLKRFKKCTELTGEGKYIHVENDGSYFAELVDGTLNLYFECSNGMLDWKHNFMFPVKPYRDMDDKWYCHRGFLKVWKSIEPYLVDQIMSPDVTAINIVGYSHGAAIAQLCYEYVKFNRPEISVSGIGFGSPRVFWGYARTAVKARFSGFQVVRNGRDIVTYLPPIFFGFRHICELVELGEPFSWSDFIKCVEEKGFLTAIKEGDLIGMVKDHYPEKYVKALEDIEGTEGGTDDEKSVS